MSRVARGWAIAIATVALWLLATWGLRGTTGLIRTVVINDTKTLLDNKPVATIGVGDVDGAAGGPAGITVNWRGAWEVAHTGFYLVQLETNGPASWQIDGQVAAETSTANEPSRRTLWLSSGFHPMEIRYAADQAAPRISVTTARAGEPLDPIEPASLKPRPPRNPWLRSLAQWATAVIGLVAALTTVMAIRRTIPPVRIPWSAANGRRLAWFALACILIHGALLRLDAITIRYGPVTSPGWIAAIQTRSVLSPDFIRSDWMIWEPEPLYPHADGVSTRYRSDPYIYLDIARSMTSFYEPQFREPLFPYATRFFLAAFNNQDVAVSFASTFFSLLAIWFTYLLGASLWSRPAGLIAALGLSINYDVISLASLGWRDDAYVAMVTLCGYLMVRCWRAGGATSGALGLQTRGLFSVDAAYLEAAALGVASGLTILTRIMAVPFLVAGALVVLVALSAPWRRREAIVGVALALATVVAGPYFLNCWRVHGDPLYTFNVHGSIYSVSEGKEEWKGTTSSYVWQKIETRPFEMLDTVAQGLTTYPFGNKWTGIGRWKSGLGDWAAVFSLIGLILLAAHAEGRLLLIATIAGLLPFAFTWKVDPHFRFTEHVYPLFLVGMGIAIMMCLRAIRSRSAPRWTTTTPWWRGSSWRAWAAMVGSTLVVLWVLSRLSPAWVFSETLAAREDATATAGVRDAAFFGSGWTPVLRSGNVSLRVTTTEGTVDVRLPSVDDYVATVRLDPFPEPLTESSAQLPEVEILLNGMSIQRVKLQYTAGRVGTYSIALPRTTVRSGSNRLTIRVLDVGGGGGVGLWYVRVHPPAIAGSPR